MSIKGRVEKLEARRAPWTQPKIIFCRDDLPPDQAEALRNEIRQAADHPNLFLVVYHSPGETDDSLTRLMGAEEAEAISRKHRDVQLTRSYGHV